LKIIEKEVNCLLREEEKQPSKKRSNISFNSIFSFYFCKKTFQKKGCAAKILFGRFESFSCQKPSFFIICGE
jgi:hypothetical protein